MANAVCSANDRSGVLCEIGVAICRHLGVELPRETAGGDVRPLPLDWLNDVLRHDQRVAEIIQDAQNESAQERY